MQFIVFENYWSLQHPVLYFCYSTYSRKWYVFNALDIRGNIDAINFVHELSVNRETIHILNQHLPEVTRINYSPKSTNPKASNLNYLCIDIRKIKQLDDWIAKLKPLD